MRILLTGATGFIGNQLVETLTAEHEIYALVRRRSAGYLEQFARTIEMDLSQPLDETRLPARIDAVIHLAQSKFYKQFPEQSVDIFNVNISSAFYLLEYARHAGAQTFIFASSGGVYGYGYEKFAETDPVSPLNFYLSSKYMAELLLANYRQFFRTVIFRFFFVYGAGQRGMLIPNLIEKVQRGETIRIEGEPGLQINPIHVDDAVRAFEPALRLKNSELINVAGDEIVTLTDLVRCIEEATGKPARIEYVEGKPDNSLIGDNRHLKEVLNVHPRIGLVSGLPLMCQEAGVEL